MISNGGKSWNGSGGVGEHNGMIVIFRNNGGAFFMLVLWKGSVLKSNTQT